uniref:Uncharacterized protein n=1 Tax=Arundo donax TaxID=35708 RepID=A0A0A9FRY1_ARUDO
MMEGGWRSSLCLCARVGDHTLFYGLLVRFICDFGEREGGGRSTSR